MPDCGTNTWQKKNGCRRGYRLSESSDGASSGRQEVGKLWSCQEWFIQGAWSTVNHTSALLLPCEWSKCTHQETNSIQALVLETCNWKHKPNKFFCGPFEAIVSAGLLLWWRNPLKSQLFWFYWLIQYIYRIFFPIMLFWIDRIYFTKSFCNYKLFAFSHLEILLCLFFSQKAGYILKASKVLAWYFIVAQMNWVILSVLSEAELGLLHKVSALNLIFLTISNTVVFYKALNQGCNGFNEKDFIITWYHPS